MVEEDGQNRVDPTTPSSPLHDLLLLRPRREPFEHGLLPIPKLIFTDGTLTLIQLRKQLLHHHHHHHHHHQEQNPNSNPSPRSGPIDPETLAGALGIPVDHARLVLDSLASVLPPPRDRAPTVHDLVLFLYLQSYKRLIPRGHRDTAAVADVWPCNSAFDGYLSALSPIQLVRSNSRRIMPSQADEEAHQLSYLQKHMANILALLAESVEGEGDESLVLSLERFEHLEFLVQFCYKGGEGVSLSQAAPFFANSDPDMPAVPVPAAQVHDWIMEKLAASLEQNAEKVTTRENSSFNTSDLDVTMADACVSQTRAQRSSSQTASSMHSISSCSRGETFVEGFSKVCVFKQAGDIKGHSVKVLNCHDSVIYILAPLSYSIVYGCSDATVVLGAIGKVVRVEHCERVQVIAATKRICIANCRECVFYLGVNQQPLILGDNHKIRVAPFNTYYSQLMEHITQVGVDSTINRWDEPVVLGMVDPHDSLSHPAGVSDTQAESATCLDPELFSNFSIPNWFGVESPKSTNDNPFVLPEIYLASQRKKHATLVEIQQAIRDLEADESRKREIACAIHVHFKDWLYASGNIRQLYCLQGD